MTVARNDAMYIPFVYFGSQYTLFSSLGILQRAPGFAEGLCPLSADAN